MQTVRGWVFPLLESEGKNSASVQNSSDAVKIIA